MTYKELYDKALWDLEHDNMTLGEFERITEPLNKEIPKEEQADGDLISRQAVLKILSENRFRYNISKEGNACGQVLWSENLYTDIVRTKIEKLPSAEKTVKREEE